MQNVAQGLQGTVPNLNIDFLSGEPGTAPRINIRGITSREKPHHLDIYDLYNIHPTSWDKNPDGTWANTEAGRVGARLTDGGRDSEKVNMFQTTFSGELSFLDRMIRINSDFTARRDNVNYNGYQTMYNIGKASALTT